jgi:hypothetical protein
MLMNYEREIPVNSSEAERAEERQRDSIIFVRSFPGYARSSFW